MNKQLDTWTQDQISMMNNKDLVVEMLDMLGISPVILTSDEEIEQMKTKLTMVETAMGISISRF